jgi:acyl dehydratase
MPLNTQLIGRDYPPATTHVTLEALQKYARAYNDDNPRFFDPDAPGGIVAPPMFGVTVTWLSLIQVIGDSELGVDLLRLLHSEQDMEFLAPLRPGDEVESTARIASIEARPGADAMTIELRARNRQGTPVLRSLFGVLIRRARRERGASSASPETRSAERPATTSGEPAFSVTQTIDPDQTYRYAEASGDRNPIHVDDNVAKMAGLPGIIVHGLCTMAFVSKVMIDRLGGGDPLRLKRLRVQFSRPVFPGQSITTRVWEGGTRDGRVIYTYETYNPEAIAVIRGGIAEIAS